MALSVTTLEGSPTQVPSVYFSQPWLRTLESMLDLLMMRSDNRILTIEPTMGLRYQGDFYGLLMAQQIPMKYFWIIMRMNGFTSPDEYEGHVLSFVMPSETFIDENLQIFKTYYRSTL